MDIVELFGERCPDYDPDCVNCFVWKQHDEIEFLRKAKKGYAQQIVNDYKEIKQLKQALKEIDACIEDKSYIDAQMIIENILKRKEKILFE